MKSGTLWPVYACAAGSAGIILLRFLNDTAFNRFDQRALYLFIIAGVGVLLPYLLRELPRLRKVQLGDTVFELTDLATGLPNIAPLISGLMNSEDFARRNDVDVRVDESWRRTREEVKTRSRDIFLAHALRPSNLPNQRYDIFIFLSRPKNPTFENVEYAEFFFGQYWGDRIFKVKRRDKIGVATSAYEPFVAICKVTFTDGSSVWLDRLVDFEMARIFEELATKSQENSSA